jgi:Holliday junction resolvasome RuvABC endonuclease subunit
MKPKKNARKDVNKRNKRVNRMRVIAIDPGISFGWAVAEDGKLLAYGKVNTDTHIVLPIRLNNLRFETLEILKKYQPDKALLEEMVKTFDRKRGGRVVNRASLQMYSVAWGQINGAISERGVPCEYIKVHKKKMSKKIAQLLACQITGKKRIDHNVAESICWAVGGSKGE